MTLKWGAISEAARLIESCVVHSVENCTNTNSVSFVARAAGSTLAE